MENNKFIIISFNTTTDAMAFEKFCIENKIGGKLISVPKEIDAGCGLAWEMKIKYDEVNNDRIVEEKCYFEEGILKIEEDKLKLEKTDIKQLNEVKDMVNENNLKCDKIVVFEKNKK